MMPDADIVALSGSVSNHRSTKSAALIVISPMNARGALLTTLCERTRQEAFDIMLTHAHQMGANAVVGVRYDATELMPGVTEVLCYGTAVVVREQLTSGTE